MRFMLPPMRTTFGTVLSLHRRKLGWTQAEAAAKLHVSKSLYEKIEAGTMRPQPAFAADCDDVFGTAGEFAVLQRDATKQAHPSWFAPRVELEESADAITDWEPRSPHGLLQTEEFAFVSMSAARPYDPASVIDEAVRARMDRQAIFDREVPPRAWFVLYEASLVQLVGEPGVMCRQIGKIIEVAESTRAVVQVLPFTCADAPGTDGPLAVFERNSHPPVAYAEGYGGGRVIEAPEEVDAAITALNVIKSCALSPKDSIALLHKHREAWL